jgi:hypothetical protein
MFKIEKYMTKEEIKNIEIKVEGKKLCVFERFPDFVPFIGEKYGNGQFKKILLIWESYYDLPAQKGKPEKESTKLIKDDKGWYLRTDQSKIQSVFPKKNKEQEGKDYERGWNFASKMHKDGKDRKSPTFRNVENILNKITNDKNSFCFCAGYNFYLRPAIGAKSIKPEPLDEDVAVKTLQKIIEKIKPELVVFFTKMGYVSYKIEIKANSDIKYKRFQHPACAWWNKESGKNKITGKERFEKWIEKNWKNIAPTP